MHNENTMSYRIINNNNNTNHNTNNSLQYCPACIKPCPEHNVTYCATCHKHEYECDYGACQAKAIHQVSRYQGERLIEVRPACDKHKDAVK